MSKLEQGTHLCKITTYGMIIDPEGKKTDSIFVEFENKDAASITWFGYLSEKAAPYTVEKLVKIFGLMAEPNEMAGHLERIAVEGIDSGLLNTEKEYELVVENETYEGKVRAKVKYINDPGAPARFGKIAVEQVKGRFAGLNLPGVVAAMKVPPFRPKEDKTNILF